MRQLADEAAERRLFFDQFFARFEVLRADPEAWREIEAERALESGSDLTLGRKVDTALTAADRREL